MLLNKETYSFNIYFLMKTIKNTEFLLRECIKSEQNSQLKRFIKSEMP